MRTLTDAFAPGTPPLPEGLRTLHVSPGRVVEPGMTVHANFTFRNPGAELQLRAQIHNSGQSSAHDVVALLPVPANTTYVPGSARIDGRAPESVSETEPFGLTHPTIVAPTLGPGATIDVGYRVSVDPVLADGTAIAATGSVCT